jgi:AcrR family transcriptional regulator
VTRPARPGRDESPDRLGRSPQARQALPREFIDGHRRRRVVIALAQLLHEGAAPDLPVWEIVKAARMSRNTFYELFAGKVECLRFAREEARRQLFDPALAALDNGAASWLERLGAALGELLGAVAAEPLLAELCLVHSPSLPGEPDALGGSDGLKETVAMMGGGREAGRELRGADYREPPAESEELIAGAILATIALRIRHGELEDLSALRRDLVGLAAGPFVGFKQAGRYGRGLSAVR